MTRRQWLALVGAAAWRAAPRASAADSLEQRIAGLVQAFSDQGVHRTGTAVDSQSGAWLENEVRARGLAPVRSTFTLSRVDPEAGHLTIGNRRIDGLPLFDGAFTGAAGLRGRLGPLESDAEIGLVEAAPNTAGAGALGQARRQSRHRAIVCVTRGGRPGLCPNNADAFGDPFGPPVLQVSSEETAFLTEQAQRRADIALVATVKRTTAPAFNVTATIAGANASLPPLVVMTPRSGWYTCASERGGGIVCWLELMRALQLGKPSRNVLFIASSGHELGHMGIDAFVAGQPAIVKQSAGWVHLGANIGAVTGQGTTIQASDDAFENLLAKAMDEQALRIARRNPRGTVPGGEAEVVHRGGGRYVSAIGSSALFHNPEDRGAAAVDAAAVAKFISAFTTVAQQLMG